MPESRLSTTERVQQALTWWLTEEYLGRIRPWPSDGAAAMCLVCEVARLVEALAEQEQALKDIEEPTCEFCSKSDPPAMHVCCSCWNSANNDTWQRRAIAAEAQLAEKDQEGDRLRGALLHLRNEVAGWREADLAEVGGWTNTRCLKTRQAEAEAALAPPPVAHGKVGWTHSPVCNHQSEVLATDRMGIVTCQRCLSWIRQRKTKRTDPPVPQEGPPE